MAAYNRWMNEGIYASCTELSDDDRHKDCGAFFGSIHATLNHLLWADQLWMYRIAAKPKPVAPGISESLSQYESFDDLRRERAAFDQMLDDWASTIEAASLEGDLAWYSGSTGREFKKSKWLLVTHMFNHQTHHRGQVHCMLTQLGVKTPPTDLALMP